MKRSAQRTARTIVRATALLASSCLASPLFAQSAEPTADAATNDVVNEDIVVTARRRDESLLQIPVAITAMTDEAIEARGISDITELSDFAPGFFFNNENLGRNDRGFTTFTFRGMDAGTFLVTRQPAQAFLDGVPIVGGNIPGLEDVERVEVIKGPQSAYFGRSTFSGAINFITKDPSDEWGGRIRSEVARFGTVDTSLMVEGGVVPDKLAVRLTGRYYTTDGQYRNAADSSERLGARSTKSVAGTFVATPTDGLRIKGYLGLWHDKDGPAADSLTGAAERNCDPLNLGQNFYTCGRVPFKLTADQIGKVTTVDQRFRDLIIKNQANLSQVFDKNFIDGAGLERHAIQATLAGGYEFENGISVDLQGGYNKNDFQTIPGTVVVSTARTLNSNFGRIPGVRQYLEDLQTLIDQGNVAAGGEARISSPGDTRFRWMVGASHYWQEAQGRARGESATGLNDSALITDRDVYTTGVFTGLAFDIFETLTLNLEGRYQWDNVNSQVIDGPGGPGATTGPVYQKVFNSFQPRAILEFEATPSVNLYASIARAYRPGDFNANLGLFTQAERDEIERETGASSIVLDQEKLIMYEAGVKGRFFDDRLRLALAGYYGDWTNIHIFTNLTIGDTGPGTGRGIDIATSSGNAELYGLELEGALKVSEALSFDYSFAYTRAKLGEDYLCSTCQVLIGTRVVTGNQKARVPKTQGNFGVTYTRPVSDTFDLLTRLDYIHKGNIYAEDANLASTGVSNRFNASLTLQRDNLSFTLFGTNIFNDKTVPSLSPTINSFDRGTPIPGFPQGPGRAVRISLPERPVFGLRTVYKF